MSIYAAYNGRDLAPVGTVEADNMIDALLTASLIYPSTVAVFPTTGRLAAERDADSRDGKVVWASSVRIASRGWEP